MTTIRTTTEVTATLHEDWEVTIPEELRGELASNHLTMFDFATTGGTQTTQTRTDMPVRTALEVDNEETATILDAFIVRDHAGHELSDAAPLDYVHRATLIQWLEALPEDGANKSRDSGRGYAQAVRDMIEQLKEQP